MKSYSILRRYEERCLASFECEGRVLDLGGHKDSNYFKRLKSKTPVEIANFDAHAPSTHKSPSGATHVFDFEKPFPLDSAKFDTVLCVNVLEHIYDYENVLSEARRILTDKGSLYITVPFFFHIHSSPYDYFRYTKSALVRMITDAGFRDVEVRELGYGPCSAVFQNFGGSLPTSILRIGVMHCAIALDRLGSALSKRYASIRNRVPLGYFVIARV